MPKITKYKSLIENEFHELFKKHKFVMKHEDDYKIEYSNGKCIMKFTLGPNYFDYSLDLCNPHESKKHPGYAAWGIIKALNLDGKNSKWEDIIKQAESIKYETFKEEEDAFIEHMKGSSNEVDQYLGFVLEGDFSFKEKYDKWNNDYPL